MKRFSFSNGCLIEADYGYYPVQYFKGVRVAGDGDKGANPGDLIFEFLFPDGKMVVIEPSNPHIRKGQLSRVHRHYANALSLLSAGGGCNKK